MADNETLKQLNILKSRIDAKADAGTPIVLFSAVQYLSMTNHVTWTKVDVSAIVPNNAVAILFQVTANSGTYFQLSARACGSAADPFIKIETDSAAFGSGPVIIPIGPDVADSNKLKFEYMQGADGSWTYGVLGYIVGPLGGSGGGAGSVVVPTTFVSLTDTFAAYAGLGLKHLRVNVGETGVEAGELITVSAAAPSGGSNGDIWIQYNTTPSVGPHQLDSALYHTVSGLTTGHFLKALSATTFGFAAHGLGYADVGAAAVGHNHSGVYAPAFVSGTANYFWATPNGAPGVPSLRAIVAADIPALSYEATGAVSTHNALATAHGFTTAGKAIANLTNPGAITFLRVNADNSASLLSASDGRTALGLAIGTNVQAYNSNLTGINQALDTTASPSWVTGKFTALTDGYIPYHVSDAVGLANSGLRWDGTNFAINHAPAAGSLLLIYQTATGAANCAVDAEANGAGTVNYAVYAYAIGAGTNWGIYSAAGGNYFNGSVLIGATAGGGKLFVRNAGDSPSLTAGASSTLLLSSDGATPGSQIELAFTLKAASPYCAAIQARDSAGVASEPLALNPLGGSVLIGATAPVGSEKCRVNGDIYIDNNCSALSFTDRTPYYEGDAMKELSAIRGKDRKIDHTTLPKFAQAKNGERDLGAMISMLVAANQQIVAAMQDVEAWIKKIESTH